MLWGVPRCKLLLSAALKHVYKSACWKCSHDPEAPEQPSNPHRFQSNALQNCDGKREA